LARLAAELGRPVPNCVTVRLNGQFSRGEISEAERAAALAQLREQNLDMREFVLFVSTIEPRKNHALALSTWSRMIKTGRRIPLLVCVGAAGWYNEAFHQTIIRDVALAEKVLVLIDVSDQLLRLLYENCMFTIYPSRYEGWGLPVSESIGYGKVPLISRAASLPEVGGDLAVYFDLDSEMDFQEKLEQLANDECYRKERERRIAAASNLRSWADIGKQILHSVKLLDDTSKEIPELAIMRSGRYYSFGKNQAMRPQDLCYSAEVFRDGLAWYSPEEFRCWVGSPVDIAFSLADEPGDEFQLYLNLVGTHIDNTITLSVPSTGWTTKISVAAERELWERLALRLSPMAARREVRLRATAEITDDFARYTEGTDLRRPVVGLKGIYMCRDDDFAARLAILEAITTGNMDRISRQRPKQVLL
jgi:hypothetical protein